jgi:hypothetical protein
VPKPALKPLPTPTAALVPVPAQAAAPGERPTNGKPDPLNSGLDLPGSAIKQKIIVKALADAWVRYQCDGKPVMKFMLRKDRILVLRGFDQVRFQVSNPSSVSINANGRGTRVAAADRNLVRRQETATLIFPATATAQIEQPFPGEKPLPSTTAPEAAGATPPPAGE